MKKEYNISGMTCQSCVSKVKSAIESVNGVDSANIQLQAPQGIIKFNKEVPFESIRKTLEGFGKYQIHEIKKVAEPIPSVPEPSLGTYKPLILIVAFITGVTLLSQFPFQNFSGMLWMQHFMAGFFIVFAFFKLLNLEGFANSYRMYDILAAKWKGWGWIYPFVELLLGIGYLIQFDSLIVNITTIVVLGVSSIGVIKSNLDKKKIKCACLGDVFNLPMSTVTIVEDLLMVAMAVWMIIWT